MLWMTSASELFHSRRYRFSHRHNAVDVSGFDSSIPDNNSSSSSSSSHQHRTSIRRHSNQNNRREHRHDLDGCEPASRRIHRRRLDHLEHEAVNLEQGRSQSPSGSIINSDDFRCRGSTSDRLPGAVLLARERLVERLRGVSVSGNRGSSSITHEDEFSPDNNLLEPRLQETARNHPHGLAQDAINCLQLEVYSNENDDFMSRECTICLEGFNDGNKLIRLNCTHTFHSCCLLPWLRVCGACPNCRKPVLVCRSEIT